MLESIWIYGLSKLNHFVELVKLSVNLFSTWISLVSTKEMLSNRPICVTRSIYLQPAYTLFSCSASLPCAATILGFLVFRSVVDRRLQTCLAFYNRFILNNLNGSAREDGGRGHRQFTFDRTIFALEKRK